MLYSYIRWFAADTYVHTNVLEYINWYLRRIKKCTTILLDRKFSLKSWTPTVRILNSHTFKSATNSGTALESATKFCHISGCLRQRFKSKKD